MVDERGGRAAIRAVCRARLKNRTPRAAVGGIAVPVHAQLRDGREAHERPVERKRRQGRIRSGACREPRDLPQLEGRIEGIDLRRLRMDRVADARRARVDLREGDRPPGGVRIAIEADESPELPETELPVEQRECDGCIFLTIRTEGGAAG